MFSIIRNYLKRTQAASCLGLRGYLILMLLLLNACATRSTPNNVSNVCDIFQQKPHWYKAAKKSIKKWGGPMHVPMAIIHQESRFDATARPPMNYFLGVIPKGRASDAYGYSQALKNTWREYEKAVGSRSKDRDDFADSFDFVLWYMHKTYTRNGVSKWDAYAQYLNYHEGHGGFSRGSYQSKQWLIDVANKVNAQAQKYAAQLNSCKARLDKQKTGWF